MEICSLPNDKIVIVCEVNDNKNNTYTLLPKEVALGKVDENNIFHSENNELTIPPIEGLNKVKTNLYYVYADTVTNICNNYDIKDVTCAMLNYMKEIARHLLIAVVDGEMVKVYSTTYEKISPEISGGIKKKIDVDTQSKVVNQITLSQVDLNRIDNEGLEKYLKERLFHNDRIIEDICTIIASNYRAKTRYEIKNMLSIGPTGTGKTETYRLISEYLGIPLTIFGCEQLTASGYVGSDIEDVLRKIYANSKGDLDLAKKSIVFFDEIDKIASRGNDVTDLYAQYELLKFLDGFEYTFALDKKGILGKTISLDTTFMTICAGGAFEDLYTKKKKEGSLGFSSSQELNNETSITRKDLIEFGIIKELVGRMRLVHQYKNLTKEDLKIILLNSLNSPLNLKMQRYNREYHSEVIYDMDFIDAIIDKAYRFGVGARELAAVVDETFIRMDRELLSRENHGRKIPGKILVKADMVYNPDSFDI